MLCHGDAVISDFRARYGAGSSCRNPALHVDREAD
jgi:hypothetical protein